MRQLVEFIKSNVTPEAYYPNALPGIRWRTNTEPRTKCVFHDDNKTESLHINPNTGAWYCHGCKAGGNSLVSFHARANKIPMIRAARQLFHQYIHPIIPPKTIRRWKRKLNKTPSILKFIIEKRGVLPSVIDRYNLGWDGNRIIIPIENEFGLVVNAKCYDPLHKKRGTAKMINYTSEGEQRSYGSPPMMFPLDQFDGEEPVMLCEGEWDTLLMISMRLKAVTSTAGAKSWPKQYTHMFKGRDVIVAYDADPGGKDAWLKRVFPRLKRVAKSIRRLTIPEKYGKDLTDWWRRDRRMREAARWVSKAYRASLILENPDTVTDGVETVQQVPLDQASQARWYNQRISVEALVTGKDISPYLLPKKFRVTCNMTCEDCPLTDSRRPFREVEVDLTDARVLEMIEVPQSRITSMMVDMAGFSGASRECGVRSEVVEAFNIEGLVLIPTIGESSGTHVMRPSFFVGHGLQSNRAYHLEGKTVSNPKDQHATHLFDVAKPVQDEVETFELTPKLAEDLKRFQPKRLKLMAHLMNIAEWQSRNITKIKERPDLHIAVDLVYHSLNSFEFNGEFVARGMLDVLIIGDTRCGKGFVTEGLKKYYELGEIASGENCSFAGLVGGLQQIGKRWMVTWGVIPLNHDRLVVIDEASSLTESEFGHMSRVRSEGIAEISKIVRESTRASTRLIWLSNARSGRPMMSYNSGVLTIKELVGANEDVSRFDFAVTVATNEVKSEIINAPAKSDLRDDSDKYPRQLSRSLILWAWSRRPDQIHFTEQAVKHVIQESIKFGNEYSPDIPLVQAENIRIKLAKVSAAVAARVFSTKDGHTLVVTEEHVKCACQFLRLLYSKASMGYDTYSESAIASSTMQGEGEPVEEVLDKFGRDKKLLINGLLELQKITSDNLADYVGDVTVAKGLIGDLVKLHCLTRIENFYMKNPAFSSWLRAQK